MPKFDTLDYSDEEINECRKDAYKHNCKDCACTINECVQCLDEVRYFLIRQHQKIVDK